MKPKYNKCPKHKTETTAIKKSLYSKKYIYSAPEVVQRYLDIHTADTMCVKEKYDRFNQLWSGEQFFRILLTSNGSGWVDGY